MNSKKIFLNKFNDSLSLQEMKDHNPQLGLDNLDEAELCQIFDELWMEINPNNQHKQFRYWFHIISKHEGLPHIPITSQLRDKIQNYTIRNILGFIVDKMLDEIKENRHQNINQVLDDLSTLDFLYIPLDDKNIKIKKTTVENTIKLYKQIHNIPYNESEQDPDYSKILTILKRAIANRSQKTVLQFFSEYFATKQHNKPNFKENTN